MVAVVRRRLNGYLTGVGGFSGSVDARSVFGSKGIEWPRANAMSDNSILVDSWKSGSSDKYKSVFCNNH